MNVRFGLFGRWILVVWALDFGCLDIIQLMHSFEVDIRIVWTLDFD